MCGKVMSSPIGLMAVFQLTSQKQARMISNYRKADQVHAKEQGQRSRVTIALLEEKRGRQIKYASRNYSLKLGKVKWLAQKWVGRS